MLTSERHYTAFVNWSTRLSICATVPSRYRVSHQDDLATDIKRNQPCCVSFPFQYRDSQGGLQAAVADRTTKSYMYLHWVRIRDKQYETSKCSLGSNAHPLTLAPQYTRAWMVLTSPACTALCIGSKPVATAPQLTCEPPCKRKCRIGHNERTFEQVT